MQMIDIYADGRLVLGGKTYRCALGPAGVIAAADKREGDLKTPAGEFPIREIWRRADRVELPHVDFPVRDITQADGWCDAPADANYNRHVRLPYGASHETLWRADNRYDVMVAIGHNDSPPVPGMGSAIFFHIAADDYAPTHGCIAVSQSDMLEILPQLRAGAVIRIHSA